MQILEFLMLRSLAFTLMESVSFNYRYHNLNLMETTLLSSFLCAQIFILLSLAH